MMFERKCFLCGRVFTKSQQYRVTHSRVGNASYHCRRSCLKVPAGEIKWHTIQS